MDETTAKIKAFIVEEFMPDVPSRTSRTTSIC